VVAVEELRNTPSKEVHAPIRKRVVTDAYSTSLLKAPDCLFVSVVIEVIDDKVDFNSSVCSVCKFLEGNTSDCLVVHVVSGDACIMLSSIDFLPEQVPEAVVIFVYAHLLFLHLY